MIGLDTSFLVVVTHQEHPAHASAWELFTSGIRGHDGSYALVPQVLTEYIHVITDPRRFERPLQMNAALAVAEHWWQARECRQVQVDSDAVSSFLAWMSFHRLGRKRILDTMLAASYRAAGVSKLATTDWRDFELFDAFEMLRIAP